MMMPPGVYSTYCSCLVLVLREDFVNSGLPLQSVSQTRVSIQLKHNTGVDTGFLEMRVGGGEVQATFAD